MHCCPFTNPDPRVSLTRFIYPHFTPLENSTHPRRGSHYVGPTTWKPRPMRTHPHRSNSNSNPNSHEQFAEEVPITRGHVGLVGMEGVRRLRQLPGGFRNRRLQAARTPARGGRGFVPLLLITSI